jgi:hypothetical protein
MARVSAYFQVSIPVFFKSSHFDRLLCILTSIMHNSLNRLGAADVDILAAIKWTVDSRVSIASPAPEAVLVVVSTRWFALNKAFVCEVSRQFMHLKWQTERVLLLHERRLFQTLECSPELEHVWLDVAHRISLGDKFVRGLAIRQYDDTNLMPSIAIAYVHRPGSRCLSLGVWHAKPNRYQRLAYVTFRNAREVTVDWEKTACSTMFMPFQDSSGNEQFAECSLPMSDDRIFSLLERSMSIARTHGSLVASRVLGPIQSRLAELLVYFTRADWLFFENYEVVRVTTTSMGG